MRSYSVSLVYVKTANPCMDDFHLSWKDTVCVWRVVIKSTALYMFQTNQFS